MTDTPTTAEQMREAAARACEAIEDFRWQKWKAEYDPNDQGMSIGACECAAAIRALPCAPDPRIAALEAERDRMRETAENARHVERARIAVAMRRNAERAAAQPPGITIECVDPRDVATILRAMADQIEVENRAALEGGRG